jgi:hypothetical protein
MLMSGMDSFAVCIAYDEPSRVAEFAVRGEPTRQLVS